MSLIIIETETTVNNLFKLCAKSAKSLRNCKFEEKPALLKAHAKLEADFYEAKEDFEALKAQEQMRIQATINAKARENVQNVAILKHFA